MKRTQSQLANPLGKPEKSLYVISQNFIIPLRLDRSLILQPLARNLIPRRKSCGRPHKRGPGYAVRPRIRAFRSFHEAKLSLMFVSVTPDRSKLGSGDRNSREGPRRSEAGVNEGYWSTVIASRFMSEWHDNPRF